MVASCSFFVLDCLALVAGWCGLVRHWLPFARTARLSLLSGGRYYGVLSCKAKRFSLPSYLFDLQVLSCNDTRAAISTASSTFDKQERLCYELSDAISLLACCKTPAQVNRLHATFTVDGRVPFTSLRINEYQAACLVSLCSPK